MIYIFHGENLSFSRDQILKIQKTNNFESKTEILIENITSHQLSDIVSSFDFFGNPPFVVLDISNVGRTNTDDFIDVLKKAPEKSVIAILSSKELSKANAFIKAVPELKAKVFFSKRNSESNIFNFIDSVFSGKRDVSYRSLATLINSSLDPIYILTMLEYALRNVAYIKFNSSLMSKMNPFTKIKAINQAGLFSEEAIKDLYEFFYNTDLDSKTGEISQDILILFCMEKIFSKVKS